MSYGICMLHKLNEGQSALGCLSGIKGQRQSLCIENYHGKTSSSHLRHTTSLPLVDPTGWLICMPSPKAALQPHDRADGYTQQTKSLPTAASVLSLERALSQGSYHSQYPKPIKI